jgi:maltooligosyltrehalose trehalohydrolase
MKHCHAMPFGAAVLDDGRVRFGLWAPAAHSVEVILEPDGEALAMAERDGWFELVTGEAHAGSRYRYRIDGQRAVPDPASRFNPSDVHGPSEVIDPGAYAWRDGAWSGRPWEEAVLYELHVGAFSPAGTFAAIKARLGELADLGVTAIELMPVGDFPGRRNWGYDGVLPFAPDSCYGRPEELKDLVQAAHGHGLMVLLDWVCNHFGPEGNYLHLYAPQFFSRRDATPWGPAIDFTQRTVRDFFLHSALYWLEEYQFDGLRLDAVHAIVDPSEPDILGELAEAVQRGPGAQRRIHLVLENDRNAAHYLHRGGDGRPRRYTAQWNDDFHHALHVLLTGERDGYYADYADDPARHLGRALTEGFSYQGEPSAYRGGRMRGEPSAMLPPAAFVNFLQTHDQVGNRAFGERLGRLAQAEAVRAAAVILLLAPSPPLLFMGEEFGAPEPFLFFCNFGGELAEAVASGRRQEFAAFGRFSDAASRAQIPDPNAYDTYAQSRLHWHRLAEPQHRDWLAFHRELLALRRREIVPRMARLRGAGFSVAHRTGLRATWACGEGHLSLLANLGEGVIAWPAAPPGRLLYATAGLDRAALRSGGPLHLAGWQAAWWLDDRGEAACLDPA